MSTPEVSLTCRGCNQQRQVPVEQVSVLKVNGRTTYGWTCHVCKVHDVRIADVPVLAAFQKAGVSARQVEVKPSKRPPGLPLTEDDFLQFGREIEGTS